ncbi:hypothetical protein ABTD62_21980 [Acinetobacter baumannii]
MQEMLVLVDEKKYEEQMENILGNDITGSALGGGGSRGSIKGS